MDDLLREFLTETAESLAVLDVELVKLEQNPNDPELLGNIFRLVHTIKGTCGFIGLPRLERVAHAGENVLGKVRDGELEVTPEAVSIILECLDRVRSLTAALEEAGAEPEGDDSDLIQRLNALADGAPAAKPAPKPAKAEAKKPKAEPKPEPQAKAKPAKSGSLYDRVGGMSVIDSVVEVFCGRLAADERFKAIVAGVNMDVLQGHLREFFSNKFGGPDSYRGPGLADAKRILTERGLTDSLCDAAFGHVEASLTTLEIPAAERADVLTALSGMRDQVLGAGSLYERLGGAPAIKAAVEAFYRRVLADQSLKPFFADVNMDYLKTKQASFFVKALGGPDEYDGMDLRSAHQHLVAQGLKDAHFDAVAGHLQGALEELGVPADLSAEVISLVATTRGEVLGGQAEQPVAPAPKAKPVAKPAAPKPSEAKTMSDGEESKKESAVAQQSIRVNVDLLENLMTMVSELVLTRNQVLQILRTQKDSPFAAPLQRLNHVTSELQEGVMKTRMQPIGNAWSKLPRLVRDLSLECGKKIDLVMLGADTELDRQVLEMIKDPLTHMVRNSADHGLETPDERRRAGKNETGKITLNAYHEGGHIIIEIADDGKGLSTEKIKAKALQNGLASETELAEMSLQQVQQFIFKAGFSTAAKVTSVSGRGVGMDVVRTNIEKIGGTIEMRSTEGSGTTFVIKIPLTLAIVSALIVECAGERFAIPQISVVELVRAAANSDTTVEQIKDTPVLRLRNRLLPLVSLRKLLKLEVSDEQAGQGSFIVVAQVGTYSFGIMVDRVFDTEEIVVKPVAPILRDISMFSGNTILGDGSVIMILDPNGIASASGQINATHGDTAEQQQARDGRSGEKVPLILFRAGNAGPKAVPLALVARLEEVDRKTIERSNDRHVVQYRGQLMPLVAMVDGMEMPAEGRQPVLVFSDRQRSMGLLVDEIVDIVEDRLEVELSSANPGRLGSAIVAGKATDIIDTGYYLTQAFTDWFGDKNAVFGEETSRRLLLVDDSPFFRNLIAPLLSSAGYDVATASSADQALKLCDQGEQFDVIISDIEMPGMSGFEFAETLKKSERWRDTPLVALSSHSSPKDIARGRKVGFDDYVAKFDRDALLQTLSEAFSELKGAA
jgi:two-component system chemotaxis sensor kinase CheA